MDVTKPYKIIGFGAMDVTKPYKIIGFGAMDVTKPYKIIGFGTCLVRDDAAIAGAEGQSAVRVPGRPSCRPAAGRNPNLTWGPVAGRLPGIVQSHKLLGISGDCRHHTPPPQKRHAGPGRNVAHLSPNIDDLRPDS